MSSMKSALKHGEYILFLLCFIFFAKAKKCNAQATDVEKIIENNKLSWSDFSGQVNESSKYWATTNWRVTYKYKIVPLHKDTVVIDLSVTPVLKATSWVLPDRKSAELLVHEQGHFDFGLLVAAEFKKAIKSTVLLRSDYNQKVSFIFNSILSNVKQLEIQYDEETNHMKNKKEQLRWNVKISEMLRTAQ
ncbi:MAG: DUF922 domain-containing protein [Cytophagaceae bacterium]|nr:MAG: DUF922 domain-containing protein [Cytophagaceae bacterium]